MKAAITQLQIHLDVLTTNEPINRAEGNTEQADLEAANAAEIRQAIAVLERIPWVVDRIQEVLKASPSSGPLWHGSTQISGLRAVLAVLEREEPEDTEQEAVTHGCADAPDFISELRSVINKHSMENGSDTSDFILATYMFDCLKAWNKGVKRREEWYGRNSVSATEIPQ